MRYWRLVETWQLLVKCAALQVQPLYMGTIWEGLLLELSLVALIVLGMILLATPVIVLW